MCAWARWASSSSLRPLMMTKDSCEYPMAASDVCQRSATGSPASGSLRCGSVLACVMLCTLCCALALLWRAGSPSLSPHTTAMPSRVRERHSKATARKRSIAMSDSVILAGNLLMVSEMCNTVPSSIAAQLQCLHGAIMAASTWLRVGTLLQEVAGGVTPAQCQPLSRVPPQLQSQTAPVRCHCGAPDLHAAGVQL